MIRILCTLIFLNLLFHCSKAYPGDLEHCLSGAAISSVFYWVSSRAIGRGSDEYKPFFAGWAWAGAQIPSLALESNDAVATHKSIDTRDLGVYAACSAVPMVGAAVFKW